MTSPVQATDTFSIPPATPTTITIPGSPAANDYVFVEMGNIFGTAALIAGFGQLGFHIGGDAATCVTLLAKKIGADTTFDVTDLPGSQAGAVWLMRGQDLTTPEDAAATVVDVAGTAVNSPSITTANNGSWAFSGGCTTATGLTPTAPTGYGDLLFRQNSGVTHTIMGAWKEIVTAGVEDAGDFGSSGAGVGAGIAWALRLAAGGAPTIVCSPLNGMIVRGARSFGRAVAGAAIAVPTLHQVLHYSSKVI